MPRQRQIMTRGWKIVKVITRKCKEEGSGNGPLTKAQVEAVKDMTRLMLFNNDKNVAKLLSEVKALSKRAIFSKDVYIKDLLKNTESAKLESFKNSLAILAGAGSVLVSAVAIVLSMQH